MDKEKKARLEARGWRVGSADEFLGLARGTFLGRNLQQLACS